MKDNNKEQITVHRNHIVPYYPKEKHIKLELQNYLLTKEIPTLKQPNTSTYIQKDIHNPDTKHTHQYNLRKRKVTLQYQKKRKKKIISIIILIINNYVTLINI